MGLNNMEMYVMKSPEVGQLQSWSIYPQVPRFFPYLPTAILQVQLCSQK